MEQVSRRSFIAGAGAALGAAAATATASAALAVEPCAPAEGGNVPESWDLGVLLCPVL